MYGSPELSLSKGFNLNLMGVYLHYLIQKCWKKTSYMILITRYFKGIFE